MTNTEIQNTLRNARFASSVCPGHQLLHVPARTPATLSLARIHYIFISESKFDNKLLIPGDGNLANSTKLLLVEPDALLPHHDRWACWRIA